jgi:histidinol dehydrogenase
VESERLALSGDPRLLAAELRALVPAPESVATEVAEIIERVRASGDDALRYYTREFDTHGATPASLRVPEAELDTAVERLDGELRAGLELAITNVAKVAKARLSSDRTVTFAGHQVQLREVPLDSAGVYAPGGRAPYPSTVVMCTVAAHVAGVREIAVCSPPGPDGDVDPVILAACRLAGASAVYRMGGVQAIAALAYGTDTVPPVDVVVGPGNLYVQEAKRQVYGQVAIDGFNGPSDLIVIATGDEVEPDPVALDLLAQAEHGPGTIVVAISDSDGLLDALAERIDREADSEAVVRLVHVADATQALAISEAFAPEHLQLIGSEAEALAVDVRRAGCVLVGPASGTAFSDYVAGSNHVLPTNGAARFESGLSPSVFRRRFTEVRIGDGAAGLAAAGAAIARSEGFELHARSMEARVGDNG